MPESRANALARAAEEALDNEDLALASLAEAGASASGSSYSSVWSTVLRYGLQVGVSALMAFVSAKILYHYIDPERKTKKEAEAAARDLVRRLGMSEAQRRELKLSGYEALIAKDVVDPSSIDIDFGKGLDDIKEVLWDTVILPSQRPELFQHSRLLSPPKGILLHGPPGTGKTMLAKAIARESGACFINVRLSTVMDKYFGESEKLASAIFSLAEKLAPSVIFFDEIDTFLGARSSTGDASAPYLALQTEILTLWDGLLTQSDRKILIIAATNRPMAVDKAVLRRLPVTLQVPMPTQQARREILRVILRGAAEAGRSALHPHTGATAAAAVHYTRTRSTACAVASEFVCGGVPRRAARVYCFALPVPSPSLQPFPPRTRSCNVRVLTWRERRRGLCAMIFGVQRNADENVSEDLRLDDLAAVTDGFSGSDLAELCKVAAYVPVQQSLRNASSSAVRPVERADFDIAMQRVRGSRKYGGDTHYAQFHA